MKPLKLGRRRDHNKEGRKEKRNDYQHSVRALSRFLSFARHPLVYNAVEVALLGYDFGLSGCVECPLRVCVLAIIISPAPIGVAQNLISPIDLNEAGVSVGRSRHVRVILAREPAIS